MKGKYILTVTGAWKNAKRHIITRSDDINHLRQIGSGKYDRRIVEIYDSKWNLIERKVGA